MNVLIRCLLLLACLHWVPSALASDQPNILLIMADDIGIEGLGCYGGTSYQTPNLDRMAGDGIRFTHAFAQPLCTPTRVELMTGKYNHRNWRSFGILPPDQTTFGHRMKSAGYATGIFGKWQLQSYDPPDYPSAQLRRSTGMHPKDAGFDQYALFHSLHTEDKGSRYANPTMLEGMAGGDGELKTYTGRYGTDIWVEQILTFFDQHKGQPTFVYYPMALPHHPFEPTPDSPHWDPSLPAPAQDPKFAKDMIQYMDTAVGRLLDGLKKRDLDQSTLVIFYGDNGTHLQVRSSMDDGRVIGGGKGLTTQTGIHVPLIAKWPGRIQTSVSDRIVDASDFVPTLLDVIGAVPPEDDQLDGISFKGDLLGQPIADRPAAFFWYDPRPGWDKDAFARSVFAVDRGHKLFRDGRLFRLSDLPLQETLIDRDDWNDDDRAAAKRLGLVIAEQMAGVDEPPLVDETGTPIPETVNQRR